MTVTGCSSGIPASLYIDVSVSAIHAATMCCIIDAALVARLPWAMQMMFVILVEYFRSSRAPRRVVR